VGGSGSVGGTHHCLEVTISRPRRPIRPLTRGGLDAKHQRNRDDEAVPSYAGRDHVDHILPSM
jgi:hypothetical protein